MATSANAYEATPTPAKITRQRVTFTAIRSNLKDPEARPSSPSRIVQRFSMIRLPGASPLFSKHTRPASGATPNV